MRNFFLFLIILFLKFSVASSQTLQWAQQFGNTQSDVAFSNAIDLAGNSYITGYTDTSSLDFFISKFDSSGTLIWTKTIGGAGMDFSTNITTDNNCNIYISGSFGDSLDFDPGIGIASLKSKGFMDAFLLKLDSAGNFIWVKQAGGSQFVENVGRSCVVKDNYLYWGGTFSDSLFFPMSGTLTSVGISRGLNDIFIIKLDTAGNYIWIKTQGGLLNDGIASIALDDVNNIFTTGSFSSTCDFDPDTAVNFDLTSWGQNDIFVCKLDSSGDLLWVKQFGGNDFDLACGLKIDLSNNVFLAGIFEGTMDANPDIAVYNLVSNGNYDNFILKLDSSGNMQWALSFGGTGLDVCNSLALDSSANIYTTGRFVDTVDFDPGVGVYNLFGNGSGDTFVSKINSAGNFVWANQLHGNNDNIGYSIKLDTYENIYVCGSFAGTCDFDPSNNSYNITSAGINDGYIFKWSQPVTGLYDNYTNTLIKVFPNPFTETVQINVIEKATVTISSITGQVILRTILPVGINTIDMASQKSGTYLLNVLTDKSSSNAVIIKSN
jgi:hypothetical protein